MSYPTGGPGVYPPQQQGPPPWTPPPPPPTPRGRTAARLGLAAAVLAAGLGGGIVGALLTHRTDPAPDTATSTTAATGQTPTADEVHAQDVKLCTEYVLTVAAKPNPVTSSREVLPALAALRTSLAAYPDASANLRSALSDVVDSYFAEISDFESKGPQGLVDPPKYDQAAAQATRNRAWVLCGLK